MQSNKDLCCKNQQFRNNRLQSKEPQLVEFNDKFIINILYIN